MINNSFTQDDKTFYGSLMLSKDRLTVLGEDDMKAIYLLDALMESWKYAFAQYNAGKTSYYAKAKALRDKIDTLIKCDKICKYNQRLLVSLTCLKTNT